MARDAARKTQCLNNLKQIGIALNGYVAAFGVFPASASDQGYSPLVAFLPYLELKPLHGAINLSIFGHQEIDGPNATAMRTSVATYLCPSDPVRVQYGATSYAGNRGDGFADPHADGRGLFNFHRGAGALIGPAAIGDGLSSTAAFGEWLIGQDTSAAGVVNRSTYLTPAYPLPEDIPRFLAECRAGRIPAIWLGLMGKGQTWIHVDLNKTLYNHVNPPNQRSCSNGELVQMSAWVLGSLHGGGANLLAADGHVAFVKDGIDPRAWTALGTRAGGDVGSFD
jgi:prepilin-type processing-associated H-X9-DG protein